MSGTTYRGISQPLCRRRPAPTGSAMRAPGRNI